MKSKEQPHIRTVDEINLEIDKLKKELDNVEGTPSSVFTRIVGYYRAVHNWNPGKAQEFKERKMFDIGKSEQRQE
jgi:anaerobic ribonucleoside-triphosphate reductase